MATITETGTIDLKAQKEAHDEASQVATNYITPDGTSTAAFHPEASSTNQVKVDGSGVDIIKGNTSVAKYGDIARIGKSSESRVEIDYHSLKLIDKNNNVYFHISDLRDSNGVATITSTFIIDDDTTRTDTKTRLLLVLAPDSIESVKVDGSLLDSDDYSLISNSSFLEILYVLANGQEVSVEFTTSSILAKAFTFGLRNSLSSLGLLSYAEGYSVASTGFTSHAEGYQTEAAGNDSHAEGSGTSANKMHSHAENFQTTADGFASHSEGFYSRANGYYSHSEGSYTQANGGSTHAEGFETEANGSKSHAEGFGTKANGSDSHAEGDNTQANGSDSHAEGDNTQANGLASHAEGDTSIASGTVSHAEGEDTQAIGDASHSQNLYTIARGEAQTAIGKYNVDNIDEDLAFIIGNGTANNVRSNAFTVDWDGNTFLSGNVELKVQTIDRDNPSADAYDDSHSILLLDKDGERIGFVRCLQLSDGRVGISFAAFNEKTNGFEVYNVFNVLVDRDGNSSYSMTDPSAFRSAISAFSTSGGTVNGLVAAKNTVIDRKANPSSAQYSTDIGGGSSFQLTDKNGATLGYVRVSKQTDGRTGLDLRAFNSQTDGSSVVSGGIQILIDRSGAVTYSIYNQANFRNAIGASSGTFPTSVGGTGITSNPSMLVNLGSTSAAGVFAASPRPGVTGTLPRANGGTGMSARTTGTVTRSGITTAGTLNAYSNGVVCTVTGHDLVLKTALANGGNVNIATLPAGYRPPTNMYGTIHAGASSRNNKGFIRITSDGVVRFSNYSDASWATNYTIAFTITWAL